MGLERLRCICTECDIQAPQTAQTGETKLGMSGCHLPIAASPVWNASSFCFNATKCRKIPWKNQQHLLPQIQVSELKQNFPARKHRNAQGVIEIRNNKQAVLSARAQSEETERVGVCEWQTRQRLFSKWPFPSRKVKYRAKLPWPKTHGLLKRDARSRRQL